MTRRKRRNHSPDFKAKVALDFLPINSIKNGGITKP
jgi:transposase-like protein